MARTAAGADDAQQHEQLQQQQDHQQQQQQHEDAEPAADDAEQSQEHSNGHQQGKKKKKKNKLLSQEKLRRLKEQHDKRGIVYISRCASLTWQQQLLLQHQLIYHMFQLPQLLPDLMKQQLWWKQRWTLQTGFCLES